MCGKAGIKMKKIMVFVAVIAAIALMLALFWAIGTQQEQKTNESEPRKLLQEPMATSTPSETVPEKAQPTPETNATLTIEPDGVIVGNGCSLSASVANNEDKRVEFHIKFNEVWWNSTAPPKLKALRSVNVPYHGSGGYLDIAVEGNIGTKAVKQQKRVYCSNPSSGDGKISATLTQKTVNATPTPTATATATPTPAPTATVTASPTVTATATPTATTTATATPTVTPTVTATMTPTATATTAPARTPKPTVTHKPCYGATIHSRAYAGDTKAEANISAGDGISIESIANVGDISSRTVIETDCGEQVFPSSPRS